VVIRHATQIEIGGKNMKRCTACVLPETYPGIQFNEEGVCNFCLNHEDYNTMGRNKLEDIVASYSKKTKYDCIVPVSGGRDSLYTLYLAKREFGVNPLAVNYDSGFRSTQAIINMEKACKKLGVDLIVVKSNKYDIEKKMVKRAIKASAPFGTFWGICQFCYYGIHETVYQVAKKEKVPLILWGNHSGEDIANPNVRSAGFKKALKSLSYTDVINALYHFSIMAFYLKLLKLQFRIQKLFFWKSMVENIEIKNVKIYDYIDWDGGKIEKVLKKELEWERSDATGAAWRFDCLLHPFGNCKYKKAFGITTDGVAYSNLIRSGKMSRQDALDEMEQIEDARKLKYQINLVLEELNLQEYKKYFFREGEYKNGIS